MENVNFVNASTLAVVNTISSALANACSNKSKGTRISLTLTNEPDMYKRNNPYFGKVTKITTICDYQIGTSWEKRKEKQGIETDGTRQGWQDYYNDYFVTDKKTHTKFYLQLQKNPNEEFRCETRYYLEGKEIPKALIEMWLKKKADTPYLCTKVENILSFKCGKVTFTKEHQEEVESI